MLNTGKDNNKDCHTRDIITRCLYTFFPHFLKSQNIFSMDFFLEVLSLCTMVSIQERFLIKSGI